MKRGRQFLEAGMAIVLLFGLGYAGLRWSASRAPACQVCRRAIHSDMRTVAFVGHRRDVFCCPTCALSAGAQLHQPVRFERLSDFLSGQPLKPADAFAVEGSDVVPCIHTHAMVDRDSHPMPESFDRCSPSILAFASRAAAERFAAGHGGRVDTFARLAEKH